MFEKDEATVYYEPGTATPEQLIAALEAAGYKGWPTSTEIKRTRGTEE